MPTMHRAALLLVVLGAFALAAFAVGAWERHPAPGAEDVPSSASAPDTTPDAAHPVTPSAATATDAAPLRVIYFEGSERREADCLLNVLLGDAAFEAVICWVGGQDAARVSASADSLAPYDVVILGDVDPASIFSEEEAAARGLADYVQRGGGLVVLAGAHHSPACLAGTPLERLLPVRLGAAPAASTAAARGGPRRDAARLGALGDRMSIDTGAASSAPAGAPSTFTLRLTASGECCPFLDIASDPQESKRLWQTTDSWRQHWAFPAGGEMNGGAVLMTAGRTRDEYVPVMVTTRFGDGRVLYVGVDELWRMSSDAGARWYGAFWKGAMRWLGGRIR
jgi:hypothetical protein